MTSFSDSGKPDFLDYSSREQYRRLIVPGLPCWHVQHMETELFICADERLEDVSTNAVKTLRTQIEKYIVANPLFLKSLEPIEPAVDAPKIVKAMCAAAKAAGVGPMAAVAGAFSAYVGQKLLKHTNQVIVENGGDIFIKTHMPKIVAVFAGESPLSLKVGITVDSREMPLSVCTSSGTVGPSLSFGKADAAVVVSPDACLADACATRLGNEIKSVADIKKALNMMMTISGVSGAMAVVGDVCGAVGNISLKALA